MDRYGSESRKLKKRVHLINLILLFGAISCLVCYDIFGGPWLKGFTSSWFVVLGLVNLFYGWKIGIRKFAYPAFIVAGLFFGMLADVLLGLSFIFGILSFAMGHICYLVGFYILEKPCKKDLFLILLFVALSIYIAVGTPFIRIEEPMLKKMLTAYAVVIGTMLGKSISNFLAKKTVSRFIILLGCIMFWVSDLALGVDMFGESSRLTWILCSYNYWPAQNILAYGLFHFVNENKR